MIDPDSFIQRRSESEERVIGDIKSLHRYIIGIETSVELSESVLAYANEYNFPITTYTLPVTEKGQLI